MSNGKNQHQLERESWLRALDYMQQENVFFKNNLAFSVKNAITKAILEEAEHFQNSFIKRDSVMALIKDDITMQQKFDRLKETPKNDQAHVSLNQIELRKRIDMIETEFWLLRKLFNEFLCRSDNS